MQQNRTLHSIAACAFSCASPALLSRRQNASSAQTPQFQVTKYPNLHQQLAAQPVLREFNQSMLQIQPIHCYIQGCHCWLLALCLHHVYKLLKANVGIMRPRGRLRVVLDGHGLHCWVGHTSTCAS